MQYIKSTLLYTNYPPRHTRRRDSLISERKIRRLFTIIIPSYILKAKEIIAYLLTVIFPPTPEPSSKKFAAELIIDEPALKNKTTSRLERLFLVTAWLVFLYFIQPLLILAVQTITGHFVNLSFNPETINTTSQIIVKIFYFALFSAILLFSWARWNLWLYGSVDRRKPRPQVLDSTVAMHFGVNLKTVHDAQNAKFAVIDQTPDGVKIITQKQLDA